MNLIMINFTELKEVVLGSLENIIIFTIVIFFTVLAAKLVKTLIKRYFLKASQYIKVDATNYRFIRHFSVAVIYILGVSVAIYSVPTIRSISVSLLAGAGVLAVVIGFAAQQALSNIVSGIIIAIFKPFRVDDRIRIGTDISGVVEDINLRHTVIRTFENKRVVVPNSVISSEKVENANLKDEKICRFVDFGISYDSNINKAIKIMQQEAMKHLYFLDNRTNEQKKDKEPAVAVRVMGFGESSVNLRAWVWAKDSVSAFRMGCDLNKSIKERFDKEGVEIPFPYRTIVYKKDIKKR
jgi:small conductance mechanosensitive channel